MAIALSPEEVATQQIDAILMPLREQRAALAAEEEQHKSALASIRASMVRIDRVIRAADGVPAKEAKKKKTGPGYGTQVSEEKVGLVLAAIKEHFREKKFTHAELAAAVPEGVHAASVAAALRVLRTQGVVRRTGQAVNNGSRSFLHALVED